MSHNINQNDFLNEKMPAGLEDKIFQHCKAELEDNAKKYGRKGFWHHAWLPAGLTFCILMVSVFQFNNWTNGFSSGDSLQEIAQLTPIELEMINHLDLIETLDDMNMEDIKDLKL